MLQAEILYTAVLHISNQCYYLHNYRNTDLSKIFSITDHLAHGIRSCETLLLI
jgi:hypothetical protein